VRWRLVVGTGILAGAVLATAARDGAAADDELPDGEGKQILSASCTSCHDLKEVLKLRGYYTRAQWRDVIVTMKEYGAEVDDKQVDILADYLGQNLGKK
jgi:cytochrome c5